MTDLHAFVPLESRARCVMLTSRRRLGQKSVHARALLRALIQARRCVAHRSSNFTSLYLTERLIGSATRLKRLAIAGRGSQIGRRAGGRRVAALYL